MNMSTHSTRRKLLPPMVVNSSPVRFAIELGLKETVPSYLDSNIQNKDLIAGVSIASGGTGYDPHET
ncbi:hypothetical protein LguiA_022441 [Lonicera macranthoides]